MNHTDARNLALLIRKTDKTATEEAFVNLSLRRLTVIQKIWVGDALSTLDNEKKL